MSTIDGEDTRESDAHIREVYRDHAREVDVDRFAAGLRLKLASATRRTRGRPVVRRLSLAMAGLLVAGGLGIGTWQAVQHLTGPEYVLVIGDTVEPTPTGSDGVGPAGVDLPSVAFSSDEPRSVSELQLADVWAKAAAALDVDPSTARLDNIQVGWGGDGLLADFNLTAVTPDGRVIWLGANLELEAKDGYIAFRASIQPFPPYSSPMTTTGPVLMTVDQVLANLDKAGLMEIAKQSGVEVVGDPAGLWKAATLKGVFGPDDGSTQVFGPTEVVSRVLWTLSDSFKNLAFVDAGQADKLLVGTPVTPVILSTFGGRLDRLGITDLPSLSFPIKGLTFGRTWTAVDKTTGQETSNFVGSYEAVVLLRPSVEEQGAGGGTVESRPVDTQLDGLAFTTTDGSLCRVRDGVTETMWKPNTEYASGTSYGASYSLGRTWLLYGAAILEVTDDQSGTTSEVLGGVSSGYSQGSGGDSSGRSWTTKSNGESAVMALPAAEVGESRELFRYNSLPPINRVQYDENSDRVWLAERADDLGETTLWTAQPPTAELVAVPLAGSFGGDFAVSPDGSMILYIGAWQVPAKVTLRTPVQEVELSLGLATAYSPVFSPDGRKVCLVGSESVDGGTSLWVYDLQADTCVQMESTEGLTPTYPAFSPDGQRIAFRNWRLGDVWTVAVDSGGLTRSALSVGEAPIAW